MFEYPDNSYSAGNVEYNEWVNADGNPCKKVKINLSRITGEENMQEIVLQKVSETLVNGSVKDTFTYGVVNTEISGDPLPCVSDAEFFHSASELVKYMHDTKSPVPLNKTNVVYGRKSITGFSNIVYNDEGDRLTDPKKVRWARESVRAMFNRIAAAVDAAKVTTSKHHDDMSIKRAKDAIADADAAIAEAEKRKSDAESYIAYVTAKSTDGQIVGIATPDAAKQARLSAIIDA
jgi:hypothetical protein